MYLEKHRKETCSNWSIIADSPGSRRSLFINPKPHAVTFGDPLRYSDVRRQNYQPGRRLFKGAPLPFVDTWALYHHQGPKSHDNKKLTKQNAERWLVHHHVCKSMWTRFYVKHKTQRPRGCTKPSSTLAGGGGRRSKLWEEKRVFAFDLFFCISSQDTALCIQRSQVTLWRTGPCLFMGDNDSCICL